MEQENDRRPAVPVTGRAMCRHHRGLLPILILLVLLAGLLLPALAMAEEPFRMSTQLEDRAGVIGGRQNEVQTALQQLQDSEQVQLWITYVNTFSGRSPQEWANQTAVNSNLGLRDVLLAVAVQDRAYAYSIDESFPLNNTQVGNVLATSAEPYLAQSDWAGAAVGAATGLRDALAEGSTAGSGASNGFPTGLLVLLLLAAAGVVTVLLVSSKRKQREREAAAQQAQPGSGEPPISLEELQKKTSIELVETDDAIKTSTEELDFATAQFGEEQAAPFKQALGEAHADLSEAFKLHKQSTETDSESEKRALLDAVLQRTESANQKLDAEADRFDRLRDLERRAPEVLDELEQKLTQLESSVPQVKQELETLASTYSPAALTAVASNPDEAMSRIRFAREQAARGREDVAAERRSDAALVTLAAQEAATQAQVLLDAVTRLGKDLAGAKDQIDAAIAETRQDIAEAQAFQAAGPSGPLAAAGLAGLIAGAQEAVAAAQTAAGPEGGRDPLSALRHLQDADDALEKALQPVREQQEQKKKAAAVADRTLVAARAQVAAASDFISTHRGAIGAEPRELVAEAQRYMNASIALLDSDPAKAAQYAAAANDYAARALSGAQDEIGQMGGMPGMSMGGFGGGSDLAGAILGGILVGGMRPGGINLGGGGLSNLGGGFGGGIFSPASFGGVGTRMRLGSGGRF